MKKIDKIILPCFAILLVVIVTYTIHSDISRQIENKKQIELLDEFMMVESMTKCRDLENYMSGDNPKQRDLADTIMRQKPCMLLAWGETNETNEVVFKFIDEMTCEELENFMQFDSMFLNDTKLSTETEERTRSALIDELDMRCN